MNSGNSIKRLGAEPENIPPLTELDFIELQSCGSTFYRITPAGWRALRVEGKGG